MKKLISMMLVLFIFFMAGLFITGCNGGNSPAENVYQEEDTN